MTQINLMPWRERQRQTANKYHKTLFGLNILVSLLLVLLARFVIGEVLAQQRMINGLFTSQIANLNQQAAEVRRLQVEQDAVRSRIRIIEALQEERATAVNILDQLVVSMPMAIVLQSVTRDDQGLVIEGLSSSYSGITELMRRLEASSLFDSAVLNDITTQAVSADEDTFAFTLRVSVALVESQTQHNLGEVSP